MSIHQRIKEARERLKFTEQELADVAGLTRAAVQQWEREGGTAPARKHQKAVAAKLKMTIAELMEDPPETGDAPVAPPAHRSRSSIYLAEEFDIATKSLTANQKNAVLKGLIESLRTLTAFAIALDVPQTETLVEPQEQ